MSQLGQGVKLQYETPANTWNTVDQFVGGTPPTKMINTVESKRADLAYKTRLATRPDPGTVAFKYEWTIAGFAAMDGVLGTELKWRFMIPTATANQYTAYTAKCILTKNAVGQSDAEQILTVDCELQANEPFTISTVTLS
jgi:hypothetical protein